MKKYVSLMALSVVISIAVYSQANKKLKDKPPTQKEMQDMMKEMQKELDGMSEEDKRMLDSMGIKMPAMNDLPKVSDAQLAEAWEDENRVVPKRDAARIASIPNAVTDPKMGGYVAAVQKSITASLNPEVLSAANEIYEYIKSNSNGAGEAGNMAIGLWMAGQPEIALYVLGKLCAEDPRNTDNLSNYSAMLSMQGAQHLAIPILNNLNARFPGNSTLLNNLGQAWFGLGEMDKAVKYLDSTIRIYAYHPQANLTKSLIEESKGNKQEAIEAAKRSIAKAYSLEKEDRLKKLGYKLHPNDLAWDRPMPPDALGLEKFIWPAYPMNVSESQGLEMEWETFREKCALEIDKLKSREKALETEIVQSNDRRIRQLIHAGQQGRMIDPMPLFAFKAMAKLSYLVDDRDGHISFSYKKKLEAVSNALLEAAKFEEILENQLRKLEEKYEDEFGEGRPNPFDAACADDTKAKNAYLSSSNRLLHDAHLDFLEFMRRKINHEMYYYQYTMWPENFELAKVQAKISWLGLIKNQFPKFRDRSDWCQDHPEEEPKNFRLRDFDDIACEYNSILNLGCVKMETNCGETITTYGCGKLEFIEKELGEKYMGGTLKLSPKTGAGLSEGPLSVEGSIGADLVIELDENNQVKEWGGKVTAVMEAGVGINKGPVKAGASVSEGLEIEIGSQGISDVNIVSSAKVNVGIEAPKSDGNTTLDNQINKGIGYVNKGVGKMKTSVELGVESRASLVSGHGSVSGKGVLSGVKLSGW